MLSIVFFGIAAWNVGSIAYPAYELAEHNPRRVSMLIWAQISKFRMFIFGFKAATQQSTCTLVLPETGASQGQFVLQPRGTDYSVYQTIGLGVTTQFLEFNVTAVNYDSQPMFC